MATWTSIPDSVLEIGKPIRSIDIVALRDNVTAIMEKASGAPQLANDYIVAAMIAASQVTTPKIADANVTLAKLAADAVAYFVKSDNGNLAVGTFALGRANGALVSAGATTAVFMILSISPGGYVETSASGTWRNVSGATQSAVAGNYNVFQRVA